MEIIGRSSADAKVNEVKDGRKVVNFSVATNDNFKSKDSDELKKVTTYFNCSYWVNSNVAKALTKGTLVELYGRISVSTYINTAGDTKASLNFHVNNIKLHGKPNAEQTGKLVSMATTDNEEANDDLPF